jgi:CheY-like chemotaxis protein
VIASLETLSYRVLVASSGAEALTILRGGAVPDLLFTDVVMPGGLNGWDLAAEARRILPNLRVLFTSGYPQEALSRRDQFKADAPLLSKPYRLADLAERIRQVLDAY